MPQSHEKDYPLRKIRFNKANSVRQETSKDRSERVADIELAYPLFHLVPHSNDQDQGRSYVTFEYFK
jgi:hypothetical protein